ncbi:MAG: hypothetical protein ABIA77_05265 [Candidatus Omnitrophota bacterium]
MIRRAITFILVSGVLFTSIPVFAAPKGQKGPGAKAYERASDKAAFKRPDDRSGFGGKRSEEKDRMLKERAAERVAKETAKETRKSAEEADKAAEKAEKHMEEVRERARNRDMTSGR